MREDEGKREIVPVGGAKQGTESELTCGSGLKEDRIRWNPACAGKFLGISVLLYYFNKSGLRISLHKFNED